MGGEQGDTTLPMSHVPPCSNTWHAHSSTVIRDALSSLTTKPGKGSFGRRAASDMTMPLGELEPVSALADEYAEGGEVFQAKISQLADTYVSLRRTRGDGNCFFRAFLFSFLHGALSVVPPPVPPPFGAKAATAHDSRASVCFACPRISSTPQRRCRSAPKPGLGEQAKPLWRLGGADLLDTSPERQQAAATLLSSWHAKLVDGGFQELVFEDALEV